MRCLRASHVQGVFDFFVSHSPFSHWETGWGTGFTEQYFFDFYSARMAFNDKR
jgi:hypothetical protein